MSLLRRIEIESNLCLYCRYFIDYAYDDRACAVFEHVGKAIPREIHKWHYDHRYPHPEDGGTQFEKASITTLQQHRYFQNDTEATINRYFRYTIEYLDKLHEGKAPQTDAGHLPPEWFMNDE